MTIWAMLTFLLLDNFLMRMQGVIASVSRICWWLSNYNILGPFQHDVMGAGCDGAWQWAGGAEDHLHECSALCNVMLCF